MKFLTAVLAPYGWRRFTPEMLARWAIAAVDGHELHALLARLTGHVYGPGDVVEPASPDDVRVGPLVEVMSERNWRGLTLERVAAKLVSALDGWQAKCDEFDAALEQLLEDG